LVKRPIPTGLGHLPAAIGKISDNPALHLLFAVETILGQMDPSDDFTDKDDADLPAAIAEPIRSGDTIEDMSEAEAIESEPAVDDADMPPPAAPFESVIAAIGDIEEIEPDTDELNDSDDVEEDKSVEAVEADEFHAEPAPILTVQDDEPFGEAPAITEETSAEIAPVAETVPVAAPTATRLQEAASGEDRFVFSQDRRATRFVWKIDAEGRFSEVSSEFAQAVGPRAADINGVAFSDLAALFNLDPAGKIGDLLKKRDTWSGKTIYWPVEGTRLVVPVDLAALPTYTRNRDFDGFRGFGIVRVADAQEDPDAIGMTFLREEPVVEDLIEPTVEVTQDPRRRSGRVPDGT
jgi:hypothetical protein